jgi:transcriptional regulator with XRE-family HTH domain
MSTQAVGAWVPSDTFANRLVLVRRELGLSVKEAAVRAGIHYATWSTWENGRKPADMVAVVDAISAQLGVDRTWLMWGGRSEAPHPGGPGEGLREDLVRHQGLEPRTRWLSVAPSQLVDLAA